MFTESFIASTLNPDKLEPTSTLGIHVHDFQPTPTLKSTFKKSSSNPNCLAVTSTHILAAQADRAVIHVYNRARGNQESTVPFPEKVCSSALAGERDGAGTLILGTDSGRVILWELGTGRQVSTPQHHLQPTACLAVDFTSNFLLSGSSDSNIHVWSIPTLLSFSATTDDQTGQDLPLSPLRSLSSHRAAITALSFGHGTTKNNIAVSTSKDNTCIIWDYLNGIRLQTFLLPETPLCLALDPVDRAAYVGYESGSVHFIDLYRGCALSQQLYGSIVQDAPNEPPLSDRWELPMKTHDSTALCIQVSYDGTSILSGHRDGKIQAWDIGRGRWANQLVDFFAPVTNLAFLPLTGFPNNVQTSEVKLSQVIKPRYGSFANGTPANASSIVPANYTFTAQFVTDLSPLGPRNGNAFGESLSHASFPSSLLDEAAACFSSSTSAGTGGYSSEVANLQAQNASLSARLNDIVVREKRAVNLVKEQDQQERGRKQDEEIRAARKKRRRMRRTKINKVMRKKHLGEPLENGDTDLAEQGPEKEQDLSDSTDEMSDSD